MKHYRITFTDGQASRDVEATSYGPRNAGYPNDNDANFTSFVVREEPREVLTIRTDAILTIEEVTDG